MSAPRACSWEKAQGWLHPGRNSSGLLISARPADRCLILPAVPRGRKSSAAGPGRSWQALGQTPCQLPMAFQHPGFECSHFPAPQQQGAGGMLLQPSCSRHPLTHWVRERLVSWHQGHPRVLCAGCKWHGHGLESSGMAWGAWASLGEVGYGLESSGMAWEARASPGELGHRLGSSGIAWGAPASPGELRHCLGSSGIAWSSPGRWSNAPSPGTDAPC